MRHVTGDIWRYHDCEYFTVIPTNTTVRRDGTAVMGAGLAKQAVARGGWPGLEQQYGAYLARASDPERPYVTGRLILLPTKRDFRKRSDLALIRKGLRWLEEEFGPLKVAMPLLGAGLGGLDPAMMRDVLLRECRACDSWVLVEPEGADE